MRTFLFLSAAWLLTLASIPAKPLQAFSTEEQTRLRAGEVLVWAEKVDKKRFAYAALLLDHPVDQVWSLLDDKEASPTYIANLRSAKILSRVANTCVIAQETEAPGTGRTFKYEVEHTMTYPQLVAFRRLRGDLRSIEGSWFLEPVDEGAKKTLLVYNLHLDAGILVPQSFIASSQMKSLPLIMTSIRAKLASQVWPPVVPAASASPLVPLPASGGAPSNLAGLPQTLP